MTTKKSDLQSEIASLQDLLHDLQNTDQVHSKLTILDRTFSVQEAMANDPALVAFLKNASPEHTLAIKSVYAINQGKRLFGNWSSIEAESEPLETLLKHLDDLENHYDILGGIVGYHLAVLKLIAAKEFPAEPLPKGVRYLHPATIDIARENAEVRKAIRWGLESMPEVSEIYPVGGAGDRLDLHDERTGEPLPAASLYFAGQTLLERLIRDLQAREYLYYKLFGGQLKTPISLMTSHEKNNFQHIQQICEGNQWFGRTREKFNFFKQTQVPVVAVTGDWVMQGHLQILVKPGGHGVIWKLALDSGIFDRLISAGYKCALVRQINNPVAGTDYGLSAFVGLGIHNDKIFGFASCPRLLNTAEGMIVLVETERPNGLDYRVTNIEYTEFERHSLRDQPERPGSPYSSFPTNTNILFVNLEQIASLVKRLPIPGILINLKSQFTDAVTGETQPAGRLESMMQNLADTIVDHYPEKLAKVTADKFRTFVTYNEREKTIAVTKKSYVPGESPLETPEGCFYEILKNNHHLLSHVCSMQLPALGTIEEYLEKGPAIITQLSPALGPFYSVIAQKIRKGRIAYNSELKLELAELDLFGLNLKGSLIIEADSPMGRIDGAGELIYSEQCGKCTLREVIVENLGIDRMAPNQYWKDQIHRLESMRIRLHGNAEFFAEGVTFRGNYDIDVPDGHRMIAEILRDEVHFRLEKIAAPTWFWRYSFDADNGIVLSNE